MKLAVCAAVAVTHIALAAARGSLALHRRTQPERVPAPHLAREAGFSQKGIQNIVAKDK